MTTRSDNNPKQTADELVRELAAARREAAEADFDLPEAAATRRAERLLRSLVDNAFPGDSIDVMVAVDGSIEITRVRAGMYAVIDIPAHGRRLDLAVQDLASGAIVLSVSVSTEVEAIREIERAA